MSTKIQTHCIHTVAPSSMLLRNYFLSAKRMDLRLTYGVCKYLYLYNTNSVCVCVCVCVSVKYRRPNGWTDHDQIWHVYADRSGNGSYLKKKGPTYGPEWWAHWGHSSKRVLSWRGSEQSEQWQRAVSQATWGIVTNKLAANTHVIGRETQIAQCSAVGGLKQLGRCLEN